MTAGDRLNELLSDGATELDVLLAHVAVLDPNPPTAPEVVASLDELASSLPPHDGGANGVLRHVYGTLAFRGNTDNYYDPRNSIIHHVLDRRLGIPLTLASVAIEIGRRTGTSLSAIAMPSHVLIGEDGRPDVWFDPFAAGRELNREDAEQIFRNFKPDAKFYDAYLNPMSKLQVVARTLDNLRFAFARSGDVAKVASTLEMRVGIPGTPAFFVAEYAEVLAALGRYDAAADVRDQLVDLKPEEAEKHKRWAERLRNHRN